MPIRMKEQQLIYLSHDLSMGYYKISALFKDTKALRL